MQKLKLKMTAVNGSHVEVLTLLNEEMTETQAVRLLKLLRMVLEDFRVKEKWKGKWK